VKRKTSARELGSLLFSFKGRIGRGTFWVIVIIHILIMLLLMISIVYAPATIDFDDWRVRLSVNYLLTATWVMFAISAKRWHDIGTSGWMTLLMCIPVVNILAFLGLGMIPGDKGSNKYGEEPLHAPSATKPRSS